VAALLSHDALWLVKKTEGAVQERARAVFGVAWWGVLATTVAVTLASFAGKVKVDDAGY